MVPECEPGTLLGVRSPDGIQLKIPIPGNVSAGDELFMIKGDDGKWNIEKAVQGRQEEAFSFIVPECEPGDTLRVPMPDGVTLQLPVPGNVDVGDELRLGKASDGKWRITSVSKTKSEKWRTEEDMQANCEGPHAVRVCFETTKGPIVIKVVPEWAPLGAERFLQLVDDGYFTDIAIYRAISGGLLQFGVVKDTDPRSANYTRIADDTLVGIPYAEGVVGFAASGPGTRKSTVCIMKADFRTQLGKGTLGTMSTETPFGMVCPESMSTMHSITCLGDIPQCGGKGPDPHKLEELGNEYIHSEFPSCDFVISASR